MSRHALGTLARLDLKSTDEKPLALWNGEGWVWVPADGRGGLLGDTVAVASQTVKATILKAGDVL